MEYIIHVIVFLVHCIMWYTYYKVHIIVVYMVNTFNIFSKTGETIEIDVTEQPDDVDVAVVSA